MASNQVQEDQNADAEMVQPFQTSREQGREPRNDESPPKLEFWLKAVVIITIALLIARVVLLTMFTVVFIDCLSNNKSTTSRCLGFQLIPNRQVFEPLLPLLSMITTIIWLVVQQGLQKDEPRSYRSIGRKLVEKLYFWKYVTCIMLVCAYRVMVFVNNIGLPGAYYYIFAPFEQIASTLLMLVSNFRERPNGEWIEITFRAVLVAAAIENITLMMVASVYISLHILTLPLDLTQRSTIYYAINLTLLAVNAKYRWIVADYFLAKTFLQKDCCILRDVGDSGELWPENEDECEERNEEEPGAN